MRLIDADALKNIHGMKDDCAECDKELMHKSRSCEFDRVYALMDFCGWIDDAPTIETERKKGKWISYPECDCLKCDQCGAPSMNVQNFCYKCGADMRGEQQ